MSDSPIEHRYSGSSVPSEGFRTRPHTPSFDPRFMYDRAAFTPDNSVGSEGIMSTNATDNRTFDTQYQTYSDTSDWKVKVVGSASSSTLLRYRNRAYQEAMETEQSLRTEVATLSAELAGIKWVIQNLPSMPREGASPGFYPLSASSSKSQTSMSSLPRASLPRPPPIIVDDDDDDNDNVNGNSKSGVELFWMKSSWTRYLADLDAVSTRSDEASSVHRKMGWAVTKQGEPITTERHDEMHGFAREFYQDWLNKRVSPLKWSALDQTLAPDYRACMNAHFPELALSWLGECGRRTTLITEKRQRGLPVKDEDDDASSTLTIDSNQGLSVPATKRCRAPKNANKRAKVDISEAPLSSASRQHNLDPAVAHASAPSSTDQLVNVNLLPPAAPPSVLTAAASNSSNTSFSTSNSLDIPPSLSDSGSFSTAVINKPSQSSEGPSLPLIDNSLTTLADASFNGPDILPVILPTARLLAANLDCIENPTLLSPAVEPADQEAKSSEGLTQPSAFKAPKNPFANICRTEDMPTLPPIPQVISTSPSSQASSAPRSNSLPADQSSVAEQMPSQPLDLSAAPPITVSSSSLEVSFMSMPVIAHAIYSKKPRSSTENSKKKPWAPTKTVNGRNECGRKRYSDERVSEGGIEFSLGLNHRELTTGTFSELRRYAPLDYRGKNIHFGGLPGVLFGPALYNPSFRTFRDSCVVFPALLSSLPPSPNSHCFSFIMAGWVSLSDNLPRSLKSRLATCAKVIWRELADKHVYELDIWWNTVGVRYIPPSAPDNDPTPQALIVNLLEGEPDYPSTSAAFTVDIMRRRVKDQRNIGYAAIPEACMPILNDLEEWVLGIPERQREEMARRAAKAEMIREAQRNRKRELKEAEERAAEAYEERTHLKRTRENRTYPLGSCQVCGEKSNAPNAIHVRVRFEDATAAKWMTSIPAVNIPISATARLVGLARTRSSLSTAHRDVIVQGEVKKIHDPKAVRCTTCHNDESVDWQDCCNERCSTRNNRSPKGHCLDCVGHGEYCSQHLDDSFEWWCSRCAPKYANPACPSCSAETCPEDIRHQCACGKIDTCAQCLPESDSEGDEQDERPDDNEDFGKSKPESKPKAITFREFRCGVCQWTERMCQPCLQDVNSCPQCYETMCDDCLHYDHCDECEQDVKICEPCLGDRKECPRCSMPLDSDMEEVAFEAMYEEDETDYGFM
ncbi:hypothetical protein EW146_g1040 [Bondarzewia mesenterica]|uniref:Uncharacterized protein n=1 Tax=Bondarzewia mesenterica TaxID=1095465 RepID=A0A4S4M6H7_9AGAM|nr:hypothetical protein EW146_g1040 [Bondarzewia mesenterica]